MTPSELKEGAIPGPVIELCKRLRHAGYGAWVVGGALRDALMGRVGGDWDIATTALPSHVQALFRRVIPTGLAHGTVTVLWKSVPYEVTTLRGEGAYSDGRHPDAVHFVDDISVDLSRRDFTVNALAFDPLEGTLVDPFEGLRDLKERCIRAVGDPLTRFREDGLRLLRAARFAATLEFALDPSTEAAMPRALDVFDRVSHERVREEWLKTMKASRPSRAFEIMRTSGVLARICPELCAQVGCAQNRWHAFDVWTHTLACVDHLRGDAVERIAALLHDLGKPRTRAWSEKTHDYTFYHHEVHGAALADRWLRDYRFSTEEREKIVALIRNHLICYSREWSDAAVRRFIRRVTVERIPPLLALARADALAKGRPVEEELSLLDELEHRIAATVARGSALSIQDLSVSGDDLMQHLETGPGRHIGDLLRMLLERVLEEPELNERARLLALAKEHFSAGVRAS